MALGGLITRSRLLHATKATGVATGALTSAWNGDVGDWLSLQHTVRGYKRSPRKWTTEEDDKRHQLYLKRHKRRTANAELRQLLQNGDWERSTKATPPRHSAADGAYSASGYDLWRAALGRPRSRRQRAQQERAWREWEQHFTAERRAQDAAAGQQQRAEWRQAHAGGWAGRDNHEQHACWRRAQQELWDEFVARFRHGRAWGGAFAEEQRRGGCGGGARWWQQQQSSSRSEQAGPARTLPCRHRVALGLPLCGGTLDSSTVRAAYRRAALRWHPDRHPLPKPKAEAEERFKAVQAAYAYLMQYNVQA